MLTEQDLAIPCCVVLVKVGDVTTPPVRVGCPAWYVKQEATLAGYSVTSERGLFDIEWLTVDASIELERGR
jgi:hypothetical protein